jgi:putative ABC transport system permease protein
MLLRTPLFTAAAVLTLALAIGSCTATFSIISFALLNPISSDQPDRLVVFHEAFLKLRGDRSPGPILDWRGELQTFSDLAAYSSYNGGVNISGDEGLDRVQCAEVSASFFRVFGVNLSLGRAFSAEEEQSGYNRVAIISYSMWNRRFAASPDVLGRSISVNAVPFTIIGVTPEGFRSVTPTDLWIPVSLGRDRVFTSQMVGYTIIGRLKPQVTLDQSRADVEAVKERFRIERADTWLASKDVKISPLVESITSNLRTSLLVLTGSVMLVILIACANVANLLLSRATIRKREIAVRAALGASRSVIARQLLVESLVLAFVAGSLGVVAAHFCVQSLKAFFGSQTSLISNATLDASALIITLAASLLTGVVAGLAPAIHASKVDLNESLKQGGADTVGRTSISWGKLFVASEIALALVLLSGAGLLAKSLLRLQKVESGLAPSNALTISIDLPRERYLPKDAQVLYGQLLSKLASIPGVRFVGAINALPFSRTDAVAVLFDVTGHPKLEKVEDRYALSLAVTPDYFWAIGMPVLKGRAFSEHDNELSQRVLIVDQSFAKRYWPNEDPIGKQVTISGEPTPSEVIGVVAEVKHLGLERDSLQEMYRPYPQGGSPLKSFVVRTETDPLRLIPAVRAAVQDLDRDLPIYDIKTMDQWIDESLAQRRLILLVLGAFALIAMVLAVGGIYSVMSYSVSQRTREFGIRMALGAERTDIFRLVVRSGLALTVIGVSIGVVCSVVLTRLMSSMLFNLEPTDPGTLSITASSLGVVAVLACLLPTYKATKVDPVVALRYE